MAHLRVTIKPDGSAFVSVVMEVGGTEFESLLDGVGLFELKGHAVASMLQISVLPQRVEFRTEQAPSLVNRDAEDAPLEVPLAH